MSPLVKTPCDSELSYDGFLAIVANQETAFENQEMHLFTPQEASKLLPDIKPKVTDMF